MVPIGFEKGTKEALMSAGHSHGNTVGEQANALPNTTPPTPLPDASFTPIKSGHPATSSLHLVGAIVDLRSNVWESRMAWYSTLLRCRKITSGARQNTQLHGDNRPRPAGMAIKACHNFAVTDSNSRNGMPKCALVAPRSHP